MSIAIREMTLADHLMVDELREAVAGDVGSGSVDLLASNRSGSKAFLTDSAAFMFGAYLHHEVAGGLWGARLRHPDGAVSFVARELYVLADVRRRGIGTLLVESAIALARRQDAQSFELSMPLVGAPGVGELSAQLGSQVGPNTQRWEF